MGPRTQGIVLAFGALLGSACNEVVPTRCAAPAGASATCAEACDHLSDIDCRPAPTAEECIETCEATGANVPEDVRGRALACYVAADTCGEVEGCSHTCGAGGEQVPWGELDAGTTGSDAGDGG